MEFVDRLPRIKGTGNSASKYKEESDALRANPNKWGTVKSFDNPDHAYVFANLIRSGGLKNFGDDFEASARTHNGSTTVYARYVG